MHKAFLLVLLGFSLLLQTQTQTPPSDTRWEPLSRFVGSWKGTSQGQPGHGEGQRDYQFILRGNFLQLKNSTVYPPQEKNKKGESHEDVGLFSYDARRKRFVLRQFHVEGFVNQYVEEERSPDLKKIVFVSEGIENIPEGWRAKETYTFLSNSEYAEVFELAPPNKDFAVYSESHWKKSK
ncbi:MAG: hypothetical protein JST28_03380 [Acidobacteria bacterium]|nr:hypothetical protein [Acidobacteriota bacterium]